MKFILKIFLERLIIFLFITIPIICSNNDTSALISTKSSAVIAGEDVIFTWENVDKYDIDPKITFWDNNSSPLIDNNFIEGSWSYIYQNSQLKNEKSELKKNIFRKIEKERAKIKQDRKKTSRQVTIKAPKEEGLYKIYYCYTRFHQFKCKYIRTLAVITCGAKNFQKMKHLIEQEKHISKSKRNRYHIKEKHSNKGDKIIEKTEDKKGKNKEKSKVKKNQNFFMHQKKDSSNNSYKITELLEDLLKENKNINNENKVLDSIQSFLKMSILEKKASNLVNDEIDSENKKEKITQSNIEHIIIFISENHSFDSIYGRYCKAETHSNPTCNYGPECCEAAPTDVDGIKPFELTDIQNYKFGPCHTSDCEISEINGGSMDKFLINGQGSNPYNFAVASGRSSSAKYYYNFAKNGAICDNFFQSSPGASVQNDMYFAAAKFLFLDNTILPQSEKINGAKCYKGKKGFTAYHDPTIADMLNACKVSWTFYAEGFNQFPNQNKCYPFYYDASDNPFSFFPSLTKSETASFNFRDYEELKKDIKNNTLPSVSYIKALGIHSEHPHFLGSFISGQMMSNEIYELLNNSKYYKDNTVLFLLPDESGGYYDHKAPPLNSKIDGYQYGPRTQFVALGNVVKKNYISHVQMEPSSLIRFIEWNWLGKEGMLWARDMLANNIGDIFDEEKVGTKIPSENKKTIDDFKKEFRNNKERINNNFFVKSRFFKHWKKNKLFRINTENKDIVSSKKTSGRDYRLENITNFIIKKKNLN